MSFGSPSHTISYNGYTFDERTETLSYSMKPKYDQSGRTTSHVIHSITLKTYITSSSSTCDAELLDIRRRLMKPGQAFQYKNAGAGGLSINVTNAATDVAWGPKPQELSYKPIGVKAAEIVWKVDVAVPECSSAVYRGAFMEFNYKLSIDIDRAGYTTRTYSGYYVIPTTRRLDGARNLQDSADKYWEKVIPDIPNGFRREVVSRELDESKARMDFTIIDSELGTNYLPPGIIDCKASHTLESSNRGFQMWVGTIQAEYECARDFAPENTYKYFVELTKQRVAWMNLQSNIGEGDAGDVGDIKGHVLPIRLTMGQPDIYGRPLASYQLQFWFYQSLENIFKSSALFLPVGNDWSKWKTSLKASAFSPRGNADMRFEHQYEVILDLCLNSTDAELVTTQEADIPRALRNLSDFCGPCPKPKDSWLLYDMQVEGESANSVLVHKPLPTQGFVATESGLVPTSPTSPSDIVQRRTTDQDVVFITGKALRVCYDIPSPRATTLGGRPLIPANRQDHEYFRTGVLGTFGCHTVIWAKWRLRYIVPFRKGSVPLYNTTVRPSGTPTKPKEKQPGGSAIDMPIGDYIKMMGLK